MAFWLEWGGVARVGVLVRGRERGERWLCRVGERELG